LVPGDLIPDELLGDLVCKEDKEDKKEGEEEEEEEEEVRQLRCTRTDPNSGRGVAGIVLNYTLPE
jgi:hypothetical protein